MTLVPVISPNRNDRSKVRARFEGAGVEFVEVSVDSPSEVCEERDGVIDPISEAGERIRREIS